MRVIRDKWNRIKNWIKILVYYCKCHKLFQIWISFNWKYDQYFDFILFMLYLYLYISFLNNIKIYYPIKHPKYLKINHYKPSPPSQ